MLNKGVCAIMTAAIAASAMAQAQNPAIKISVNNKSTGMGQTIELTAKSSLPNGKPAAGWMILPYVNGQRWGAHEFADAQGKAVFQIPLPRVGKQIITASAMTTAEDPSHWIWADKVSDGQTITVRHSFNIKGKPLSSQLWVAVDDNCVTKINGKSLGESGGWLGNRKLRIPSSLLVSGENKIESVVNNGSGPAGFLLRLEIETDAGPQLVVSDKSWTVQEGASSAVAVKDLGPASDGQWSMDKWPGSSNKAQMYTGAVISPDMPVSNPVVVDVLRRELQAPSKDPKHLIVMQWENWYSKTIYSWGTAQAVPVMGFYNSADENVMRQHIIWMIEAGTDIIQCDMSNNIWDVKDWDDRAGMVNELFFINQLMLETMAKMKDEGIDVPKFMILSGVNWTENGPKVVNAQLNALYHTFVNNPRWADLYYRLDGKPVVLLLDLPGKYYAERAILDKRWNIRFASISMEKNVDQRNKGFWSWMDNEATSVPGPDGKPEAITASIGCFNDGGWLDPGSHGRRGGATFVEDWQTVMKDKPQHIFIHQFQEFAGQPEGQGYGDKHDRYVDSYSVDLSDDLEPVSLTTPAYRGKGGWGYFYLNLNKALVDLLRQKTLETSVLVVAKPDRRHEVSGDSMELEWRTVGKPLAEGVTIAIDGKVVATGVKDPTLKLDISKLKKGLHTITLTAPGAMQRYRLAWDDDSLPLAQLEPAIVSMEFLRK